MKPEVYLIVERCCATGRELEFKYEVQPFIDGTAVDEVELTNESKKDLVKRFAADYIKVYINGKRRKVKEVD